MADLKGYLWEAYSHSPSADRVPRRGMQPAAMNVDACDDLTTDILRTECRGVVTQLSRELGTTVEDLIHTPPSPG